MVADGFTLREHWFLFQSCIRSMGKISSLVRKVCRTQGSFLVELIGPFFPPQFVGTILIIPQQNSKKNNISTIVAEYCKSQEYPIHHRKIPIRMLPMRNILKRSLTA